MLTSFPRIGCRPGFKYLVMSLLLTFATACDDLEDEIDSLSGGGQEEQTQSEPEAVTPDYAAEVIGPNLNGDDWQGHFKSIQGAYDPLSAVIQHIGNKVIMQTSRPEGQLAHKFTGIIDATGNIFMIDDSDGEDWTTLYGAVSRDSINMADFVFANGSQQDTNIIILKR